MKTDDLVSLLAAHAAPVPQNAVGRRFAVALGWSLPAAVLLLVVVLGLRADLAQAAGKLMFWIKPGFAAGLALAALLAAERLARPGMRLGRVWAGLATPVLALWLLAAVVLLDAAPAQRAQLVFGDTWKSCPVNIAFISLPLLAATLWAIKGLAPTRLALAGASAGLLAGALGALVYALHCPESTAPFMAVWYLLGIAIPTLAGALLGPRLLRW
ncbi:DUF1109 domain-containing protein [Polaromonas sp.]|uniref:DUF1109 domain-containing protein n=1 Tax=Polaromonas sp. TaxID=1869339 RepID=UPI00286C6CFF|nr:DUF1109 domain-containing protein [Polaromonas sp.]